MRKDEAQTILDNLNHDLKILRERIARVKRTTISATSYTLDAERGSATWFEQLRPNIAQFGISDSTLDKYDTQFTTLLRLAKRKGKRSDYLSTLDTIQNGLMDDLYVTVTKSTAQTGRSTTLVSILERATEEEANYLHEAIGCANNGFLRASLVLGWSAAIHRIHKVIETLGFDEFNKKAAALKDESQGRFKRFNKLLVANSISDLRATVFDSDLLWLIEYWQLIDINQHDRLEICFTMRSNSAHPGEAPITEENLASFYSDLRTMVFWQSKPRHERPCKNEVDFSHSG